MALINCPECNREISDKAKSCPSCGLPLENITPSTPQSTATPTTKESIEKIPDLNAKTCPSCKSHNVQSIKMMCLNGTSSGRSTGIGVSSNLDVGVGSMNSTSQTALAKQFSPGKSAAEAGGMIVGCSLIMLFFGVGLDNVLGHVLFTLGGFFIVIGILAIIVGCIPNKEREVKIKLYEDGWICHKCGYTWMLSESIISRDVRKDLPKDERPVEIIHNLVVDDKNRVRCPICNKGQRLGLASLDSNSFKCSSCKFVVNFTMTSD
ncbi:MAG: double zinc ribbon domain-containing protein [Desulfuromonadaceae bacterium]